MKIKLRIAEIIAPCDLVRSNKYDYITDTDHPNLQHFKLGINCLSYTRLISTELYIHAVAYRGGFGLFKLPPPRNSENIGGVLDRISKKNRRLDSLLQFTVFSYGCNLLNKGFF